MGGRPPPLPPRLLRLCFYLTIIVVKLSLCSQFQASRSIIIIILQYLLFAHKKNWRNQILCWKIVKIAVSVQEIIATNSWQLDRLRSDRQPHIAKLWDRRLHRMTRIQETPTAILPTFRGFVRFIRLPACKCELDQLISDFFYKHKTLWNSLFPHYDLKILSFHNLSLQLYSILIHRVGHKILRDLICHISLCWWNLLAKFFPEVRYHSKFSRVETFAKYLFFPQNSSVW